jgi:hypothetical protein
MLSPNVVWPSVCLAEGDTSRPWVKIQEAVVRSILIWGLCRHHHAVVHRREATLQLIFELNDELVMRV